MVEALELALACLAADDGAPPIDRTAIWNLLSVRASGPLIDLLQPSGDESAPAVLAPILEVARLDNPLAITRCPGSERAAVLGPEGRRECRTCGESLAESVVPPRDWPMSRHRCSGSLCAARDRIADALGGSCRVCSESGPLTYDGLVRSHPLAAPS